MSQKSTTLEETKNSAQLAAAEPLKKSEYSIGYLPAVDGLRAVSIALVLAFHDIGPRTSVIGHMFNGWIGVDVFFVISGYLITSILLKEAREHGGDFSLKKFYIRRWLRIAPVYYIFLAAALAWKMHLGDHHLQPFVYAALYLTNLDLAFGWNLTAFKVGMPHIWSLALEEQFYLIFPATLKFFKKHALALTSSIIGIVYAWRMYLVANGAEWWRIVHGFDTKVDTIMFGVLIAILLTNVKFKDAATKLLGNGIAQILLSVATLYCFKELGHPMNGGLNEHLFFWGVKMPLSAVLISGLLLSLITNPRAIVSVALANPLAVFIGKLSYSIYLWHPLIHSIYCAYYWDYFQKHGPTAELYQYIIIFAFSCFSYYAIEKPFLKLKGRFS